MYTYVTCIGCGYKIGLAIRIIKHILTEAAVKRGNTHKAPSVNWSSMTEGICIGELLDKLHIKKECCRTKIISQIILRDYLH